MEVASVGGRAVTACACCKSIFVSDHCNANLPDQIANLQQQITRHRLRSPECDKRYATLPTLNEVAEKLRPYFAEAESRRVAEVAANPNNGRRGYWVVTGVRNTARTLASSAQEAIDKCVSTGAVGDWESPTAEFWTEQLPDVF